nr:hypothetical protein HmN_000698300 [Hymenolepis microstoma]
MSSQKFSLKVNSNSPGHLETPKKRGGSFCRLHLVATELHSTDLTYPSGLPIPSRLSSVHAISSLFVVEQTLSPILPPPPPPPHPTLPLVIALSDSKLLKHIYTKLSS